jgi:hypothetical protein
VLSSSLSIKLDAPGLIPANRLGVVMAAGSAASSAANVVSDFGASGKPIEPVVGAGAVAAAPAAKAGGGLLLREGPFVASSGGVFGLTIVDEDAAGLEESGASTEGGTSKP